MDKLKGTFSRGKNDEPEETAGAAGKMSGPGSHFQSAKDTSGLSSNTTGTGYSPETGGDQSVDTIDPDTVGTSTDQPGTAIGQTSTYSSTPLAKGDPTSSVIDPESKDPMTYQKPERASYEASGVPEGSATVAASKAFGKTSDDMPGSYPSAEEPKSTSQSTGLTGAAATPATTEAAGSAASPPTSDRPGAAPSTLTDTTSPGERLRDYGEAEQSRGLDSTGARGGHGSQPGMVGRVLGAVGLRGLAGTGGAKGVSGHEDSAVSDTPDQPTTTTGISSSNVPQHSGPPPSHHRKESIPTTAYPAGPGSSRAVAPPVGGTRPHESSQMSTPQDDSGHRDAALGAGAVGAGAVGAGAYAAHDREDGQGAAHETATPATVTGSSAPTSTGPTTVPATSGTTEPTTIPAATWLRENPTTAREKDSSTITQPERGDHTTARETEPSTITQPSREHHTTAPETEPSTIAQPEREDHTGRNVATGTAAGVGAGAAGAYAAHEYSQHRAEEEAAKQAAEVEKQRAAQQAAHEKELEKQQKAQEKAAAKEEKHHQKEIEKEEKKHQKEIEKEKKHQKEAEHAEKRHQKELEKEEKHREKEAAAAAKEREAQESMERKRLEQEDEDRKRRERELAAGAGVGATGAGVAAYGATRDDEPKTSTLPERTRDTTDGGEVEKKPSILKRLFKRTRKNKDTGEDEEYEEEGEDDHSHRGAAAATATGAGVAGAGAYYGTRDDDKPPTSTTGATDKSYEGESGGATKPSYNSLSKKDQPTTEQLTHGGHGGRTGQQVPYETEPTPATTSSSTHRERTTEPRAITSHTGADTTGLDSTTSGNKPIEPVTGLPYDPSKDPEAAKRIEERRYNAVGTMEEVEQVKQERVERGSLDHDHGETHESGEHGKKSLGTRLKEKLLPVGGGVKEEEDLLKEEGYTHRSEHP